MSLSGTGELSGSLTIEGVMTETIQSGFMDEGKTVIGYVGTSSAGSIDFGIAIKRELGDAFGSYDLGGGWRWSPWFGYFSDANSPWIYHNEHRWMYVFELPQAMGVYLWDNAMQDILWTSESDYPNLYRFSDGEWLWYQEGSVDPRWFNVLSTAEWESW
jgi:hypothetical protein